MTEKNKKGMSVRVFAEMIKNKDKELGESLIEDFEKNSFANLAKEKVNLLLGANKVGQT